jgi:multiple sugar transport system permease protein
MASLQNTTKPSGLNQDQHEALVGWSMAMPVIVLLLTFLIVPFFMAFGMSFTNQRLISGNPTEFVGLRNFQDLLTVQLLTLDPLVDETSGELLRDEAGNPT